MLQRACDPLAICHHYSAQRRRGPTHHGPYSPVNETIGCLIPRWDNVTDADHLNQLISHHRPRWETLINDDQPEVGCVGEDRRGEHLREPFGPRQGLHRGDDDRRGDLVSVALHDPDVDLGPPLADLCRGLLDQLIAVRDDQRAAAETACERHEDHGFPEATGRDAELPADAAADCALDPV